MVEIDVEIEEDTENFLTIEYMNKDPKEDIILGEDGLPIQDKRVEIKSLTLNNIELDFFGFDTQDTLSYESLDGKQKHTGFQASKLSWNGRTTFKFSTPVYIWILENI